MDGDKHVDLWDSIYSIAGSHVGFGVSLGASVEIRHYCCPMGQGEGLHEFRVELISLKRLPTVEHCSDTDGTPFPKLAYMGHTNSCRLVYCSADLKPVSICSYCIWTLLLLR